MKKDYFTDWLGYFLLRLLGPIFRRLPFSVSLFFGERLGDLFYCFDLKHRGIAYSNIKVAFADKLSPHQLKKLTRQFYRSFGQNLIEIFFIPLINQQYMDRYISFEGLANIEKAFGKGKGVILLGVHAGSWELTNVICAHLGFPFSLLVRDQRHPRMDKLLNTYRIHSGYRLIQRQNQTRQLIQVLKNNEAIGMTVDQGGKMGILVEFFGKDSSMAQGAVKLALKYGTTIIPCFFNRTKGPYVNIIVGEPFEIKKTTQKDLDIHHNLQRLVRIFESFILRYPKEYFWAYKIWKYAKKKKILILNDGKTGHLRQSQGLVKIIKEELRNNDATIEVETIEVKFKNKFSRFSLNISSILSGKYSCQGCLWCLNAFLKKETYDALIKIKPDLVIACGSSLATVNFIIARENFAKSIIIMKPSVLSVDRFDLAIIPRHDQPPVRKNVVVTVGALNTINKTYLDSCLDKIAPQLEITKSLVLGILIGGDSKDFHLSLELMQEVIQQAKGFLEAHDAEVLITTSRRTPSAITSLIKKEFADYPRCKLLIVANENNIPEAVGGILALSEVIIVSPESISMISEAASSGRYVIVLKARVSRRHNDFLNHMARKKYIYLSSPRDLSMTIEGVWQRKPEVKSLKDNFAVSEAIKKLL
ncbi:MAG: hypothetical protein A2166_00945 [Omnitrophica WOR_2 bacterium RBG_13_41_10]|nr:MAG: hypothetical protein A2166_00945 [Omnitrophica WOR_2 bacterium RBG_13_41_10]